MPARIVLVSGDRIDVQDDAEAVRKMLAEGDEMLPLTGIGEVQVWVNPAAVGYIAQRAAAEPFVEVLD
jgi:hypothetical protein